MGRISALGLLIGLSVACFEAPSDSVIFSCDPDSAPACPPGYTCEADGCCHRDGSDVEEHFGACRLSGTDTGSGPPTGSDGSATGTDATGSQTSSDGDTTSLETSSGSDTTTTSQTSSGTDTTGSQTSSGTNTTGSQTSSGTESVTTTS